MGIVPEFLLLILLLLLIGEMIRSKSRIRRSDPDSYGSYASANGLRPVGMYLHIRMPST